MLRSTVLGIRPQTRSLSNRWKQQRDADVFANKAVKEGMRSRAAYKLEEINKRFGGFLRQGASVVDLGAAPGGFAMVASKRINLNTATDHWNLPERMKEGQVPKNVERSLGGSQVRRKFGQLICVDVQDMDPIPGAIFVRGDMSVESTHDKIFYALHGREADVVLCDMAPWTTGQKEHDHVQIMQLADEALHVAQKIMRNGGTFCCKVFSGADEVEFRKDLESTFVKVKAFKPAASRKHSKEVYYVAQGFVPAHMNAEDTHNRVELYSHLRFPGD